MAKSKKLTPVGRALSLAECRQVASESLSVFSEQVVKSELELLRESLELPEKPEKVDLSEEDWRELIEDLLSWSGATQFDPAMGYPRLPDEEEWLHALAGRVQSALRAIDCAASSVDADGGATGLLLPTSYSRRMEVLLGWGQLPVAWIRSLDIPRF